ncbi:sulfotransferase domain-containing protein [Cyanothece sp. BG0011]|uniref:sulfotransferase domain-containing protein n=1 Tax=Cyanothece sp. BG0011 TaxID=2082950 RepID=UPI000D1DFA83|nr:sulfotransferase domain-containing protein [Cyanothece sp. BG0011]
MSQPNFIVAGAQKAGTSAFWKMLKQHPQIFCSPIKEPTHWIVRDWPEGPKYMKNLNLPESERRFPIVEDPDKYERLFEGSENYPAIGEASITYLSCPWVAQRLRDNLPTVKLIFILRNPKERAFSHYLMHVQKGIRSLTTIDKDIWEIESRLFGSQSWEFGYVPFGLYYEQLTRYFKYFPPEQMKIFLYEDFCQDPLKVMKETALFLGIDPNFEPNTNSKVNVSYRISKKNILHKFIDNNSILFKKIAKKYPKVAKMIEIKQEKPKLDDNLSKTLTEYFAHDMTQLATLINRDLTAWLQ